MVQGKENKRSDEFEELLAGVMREHIYETCPDTISENPRDIYTDKVMFLYYLTL